ncbi:MAG TPA: TlpA family protein disulfide reductase [Anaerolineae bacterium]|nr:TlpA family protein disulfide reductase [Anaerolineae bacterium]
MTEGNPVETNHTKQPRRWGVIFAWALVLALLGTLGFGLARAQQGSIGVGSSVPDFTLTTFEGDEIRVADLRGQVVLLNFWASWCTTCELEARELEQVYQMYKDRGVVFLGIDYVDTEPEALAYLEQYGITYPNGPDLGTRISQAFRIRGVPETYIVGSDGRVADVMIGPYPSLQEIITDLEAVLGP